MKNYTIFAGVNGAGKTSIYRSVYYNENMNEKRINTDEMVARIGNWQDNNLQIKCAREAVKLIKKYIFEGISFNQETTLSGKSIINNIKLAKEKGFYITMNYIGVENVDIAKQRVAIRVKKGGHGIADEDIERRYYDSLKNLSKVISICDKINIYDNSEMLKLVMIINNGKIIWQDEKVTNWLQKIECLSSDKETMRIYYERERSLHERANMINSAEKRGKLEVAKNLLDILDDETIALKTGLDIEEIKDLRDKNC